MSFSIQEKEKILSDLERILPDLKMYERSEVDVTVRGPLEKSRFFFQQALLLFKMLNEDEKKRCPRELLFTFRHLERHGIHLKLDDRSTERDSLKVPEWTILIEIGDQKFGVYDLGLVMCTEIKRAVR